MGVMGNVENGWFAQLAHACKAAGQHTLNFLSCSGNFGDRLYSNIDNASNQYIGGGINQQTINQAIARGATQHQALSAGSAAMDHIADPKSLSDLVKLANHGSTIAFNSLKETVAPPIDILGALTPFLIGAGILGGAYLMADSFNGSPSTPKNKHRQLEYI